MPNMDDVPLQISPVMKKRFRMYFEMRIIPFTPSGVIESFLAIDEKKCMLCKGIGHDSNSPVVDSSVFVNNM